LCCSMASAVPDLSHIIVPIGKVPEGFTPGNCAECNGVRANFFCVNCGVDLCMMCDTTVVHISKKLKLHTVVPITKKEEMQAKGGLAVKRRRRKKRLFGNDIRRRLEARRGKKSRFCVDCQLPCATTDAKHQSHTTIPIAEVGAFLQAAEQKRKDKQARLKRDREEFERKIKEAEASGEASALAEIQSQYKALMDESAAAEAQLAQEEAALQKLRDEEAELESKLAAEEEAREKQLAAYTEELANSGMSAAEQEAKIQEFKERIEAEMRAAEQKEMEMEGRLWDTERSGERTDLERLQVERSIDGASDLAEDSRKLALDAKTKADADKEKARIDALAAQIASTNKNTEASDKTLAELATRLEQEKKQVAEASEKNAATMKKFEEESAQRQTELVQLEAVLGAEARRLDAARTAYKRMLAQEATQRDTAIAQYKAKLASGGMAEEEQAKKIFDYVGQMRAQGKKRDAQLQEAEYKKVNSAESYLTAVRVKLAADAEVRDDKLKRHEAELEIMSITPAEKLGRGSGFEFTLREDGHMRACFISAYEKKMNEAYRNFAVAKIFVNTSTGYVALASGADSIYSHLPAVPLCVSSTLEADMAQQSAAFAEWLATEAQAREKVRSAYVAQLENERKQRQQRMTPFEQKMVAAGAPREQIDAKMKDYQTQLRTTLCTQENTRREQAFGAGNSEYQAKLAAESAQRETTIANFLAQIAASVPNGMTRLDMSHELELKLRLEAHDQDALGALLDKVATAMRTIEQTKHICLDCSQCVYDLKKSIHASHRSDKVTEMTRATLAALGGVGMGAVEAEVKVAAAPAPTATATPVAEIKAAAGADDSAVAAYRTQLEKTTEKRIEALTKYQAQLKAANAPADKERAMLMAYAEKLREATSKQLSLGADHAAACKNFLATVPTSTPVLEVEASLISFEINLLVSKFSAPKPQAAPVVSVGGPTPWLRKKHPQNGKYFYVNKDTRKTQWEEPSEGWTE